MTPQRTCPRFILSMIGTEHKVQLRAELMGMSLVLHVFGQKAELKVLNKLTFCTDGAKEYLYQIDLLVAPEEKSESSKSMGFMR